MHLGLLGLGLEVGNLAGMHLAVPICHIARLCQPSIKVSHLPPD